MKDELYNLLLEYLGELKYLKEKAFNTGDRFLLYYKIKNIESLLDLPTNNKKYFSENAKKIFTEIEATKNK